MPLAIILKTSGTTNIFRDFTVNVLDIKKYRHSIIVFWVFPRKLHGLRLLCQFRK